jgi:hypothetical protein
MIANQIELEDYKKFQNEHEEQAEVIAWASMMEFEYPVLGLLYAIPNGAKLPWRKGRGGKHYSPEAMKLKAEGLRPGAPDLCLPVARGGWFGLYIEMKYGKNKPSEKQEAMLNKLTEQGFLAVVCYGHVDAKEVILGYLKEPRTKVCS